MDGDQAPLTEIATISRQHDAWLMVDDAHGIGVLGKEGRGSCDEAGIKPELLVVTFGKAFGVSGAAVLCNKSTAEFLNNTHAILFTVHQCHLHRQLRYIQHSI